MRFSLSVPLSLVLVCALAPAQANAQPADVRTLRCTYEGCVKIALERSPLIRAAGKSLELYEQYLREAKAISLPTFSATSLVSILPRQLQPTLDADGKVLDPHDGSHFLNDYNWKDIGPLLVGEVTVTQPLYTFGKISTLRRMANRGLEIGAATGKIARDEMRYQIARAWWALVMIGDMGEMMRSGTKLYQEELEKLEKLRDSNDDKFNQNDLLKAQLFGADIEDKVRTVERLRMQAHDGLRLALDQPEDVAIVPEIDQLKPIQFQILPVQAYETVALANTPKLLALRAGVAAKLEQLELAHNNLYPDIALVGRLAGVYAPTRNIQTDSVASNPNNSTVSGGGIAIRWNLDIFRGMARVGQAQVEADQAVQYEKGERERTRMEVRQFYREMVDAKAMVPVKERARKWAQGWLNSASQMYEDGFEEFPEVLRAMEAFYRNKIAHLEAIYNYNVAVAALSRATGMDISNVESVQLPTVATQLTE